ncbi:MAG: glycosyltransferase [Anaerolineae bacterium]|nr:glycosyltransferase [Anaerolineae bacterium]
MVTMQKPISSCAILIPILNDWAAFESLCAEIDSLLEPRDLRIDIHVIDDHSIPDHVPELNLSHVHAVYKTRLVNNLGHQRAIAVGLVMLSQHKDYDYVVVMDGDGEDCPEDIFRLIDRANSNDAIVVASRRHRRETITFRVFYQLYKQLFKLLTGRIIDFGNYCLIPSKYLRMLVYHPGLWNHLAATLAHSRVPLEKIDTNRCVRYAGRSHMNFTSLLIHGLSAISLYTEVVAARFLILSLGMLGMSLLGIGIVVVLRYFTDLAIPGWATFTIGLLVIFVVQMIMVSMGVVFVVLHRRSTSPMIPARDALIYVDSQQEVNIHSSHAIKRSVT